MKTATTSAIIQTLINTRQTSIVDQLIYSPTGPLSRSTLTISNVEASDNGNYICEASSGPSPPSVSANFTICVIGKSMPADSELYNVTCICMLINDTATSITIAQGSIIVTSHNHRITQSGRAELNCSVCPTLMPMFTWSFTHKEAQEMEIVANQSQPLSSQYTIRSGQKSQALIIEDAQWRHVGVYKCIADIDGMIIQAHTSLDVLSEL